MSGKLLLACLCATFAFSGAQAQPADPAAARAAWGFDRSDLTPHPGVRFGVLANGMRYAIMRSAAPPGHLSVRLHIDAGASMERTGEAGHMHLLEHMIFHGSTNLPRGALLLMLPQAGLKRFSGFNAFTSYDETLYRLDLARSDRTARDTALMLMREIATNLIFTRRAVEGAKAEVDEEIRSRDIVQDRLSTAQNAFFLPGTPIARGPVAGTRSSVRRARAAALQRLYARTYIPARTTLVLAGDFDPGAAEAEIVARFSDWRARSPAAADPPPPSIRSASGTQAHLFVDPAVATAVTIAAVEPLGSPDAGARRDALFLQHLGAEMLGRRLFRMGAASAAVYDHFSTARLALIEVAAPDRDWRRALKAGARELGSVLADGFSQAELDAQTATSQAALAAPAAPRSTAGLADAIADAVGRAILFTAPSDTAATRDYLSRIRLDDVNAAFRSAWSRPGRLIFVAHDKRIPNAEAVIAAVWDESRPASAGDARAERYTSGP